MTKNQNRPLKIKKRVRSSTFSLPATNIKIETVKRILIFSIATLILGTAQCSFFPLIKICPRTPDLIMGLVLAVALCDNAKSATILSIGAGFFIDTIGGGAFMLLPIIYFIYSVFIGITSQKILGSFPAFAVLLMASLIFRAATTTLMTLLYDGIITEAIVPTLLLEALCTFIFCLPIYPIIKLATKPLYSRSTFKIR